VRRWLIWQGSSKFIVGVAAVCLDENDQMLLLKHRFHNEYPWGFPGGWVDRGESPIEAIMREVQEETRLTPTVEELLCVTGDGHWVEIYFLCRVPSGPPTIQRDEMSAYRWVDPLACQEVLRPNQQRVLDIVQARLRDEANPIFPVEAAERRTADGGRKTEDGGR
jgi:ADP-ribose pyrophosphatase YjhB (NUDIX family)